MKWIKFYEAFRESPGTLPTKEIDVNELKTLIHENCVDFLELLKSVNYDLVNSKQNFLFRRSPDLGEMVYSNPGSAGHERISPYSPIGNYHNLILSNLESWKEYPKRNKSICTGRFSRIEIAHGKFIYLVIPYDTTKIGVAPSMDMWYAFKKLTMFKVSTTGNPKFDYNTPGLLINWFKGIIDVVETKVGHKISDTNWEELKPYLNQKYDEFAKKKYGQSRISKDTSEPKTIYFPNYDKNLTLLEYLNKVLDPNLNDFSIKYSKDLPQIFSNQSCECWIEDDCLMIKWNLLKDKDPEEIRSIFE
jgi:hypothetical protein